MCFLLPLFARICWKMTPPSGGPWLNFWGHFESFFSTVASTTTHLQKNMLFHKKTCQSEPQSGPYSRWSGIPTSTHTFLICIYIGRFGRTLHAEITGCGDGPPQASSINSVYKYYDIMKCYKCVTNIRRARTPLGEHGVMRLSRNSSKISS